MRISVIGAGIAGLTVAYEFVRAGCTVDIVEQRAAAGLGCSSYAGGMLAPWCEMENSGPLVAELGLEALAYWQDIVPVATRQGSLLVAPARDLPELSRFGRRTSHFETLDAGAIAALEPDLAGRFSRALYFRDEAHLDPQEAVLALERLLRESGLATFHFGMPDTAGIDADWTLDCRGFSARDSLPDLRGVKGEMLVLQTRDVHFSRPVQLLHPRTPVYIVPRAEGRFMIGATMVENEESGRVTARGMLDLLGAAYTVHPAFGEAEIVEMGCDLRPTFPDNLPRLRQEGRRLFINGLFRHGFLLAPALAIRARKMITDGALFPEVMDANQHQRQSA
jgi:glycine oxidase